MDSCAELRKARKVWLEAGKSVALLVLLGMSAPVAAQPTNSTLPAARPLTAAERATLWQQWRDKGSLKPISVTVPAIDLPAQFLDAKSIAVPVVSSLPKQLVEVTELNAQASLTQAQGYASVDDPRAVAMLDEYAAVLTKRPRDKVVAADQANSLLEAARFYQELGEEKKAAKVYAQVSTQGFSWTTGMVLWDQAFNLIGKERHEEARKLLLQPVTGQYADQIKVGLLSLLSYSYYRSGKWEEAQKHSRETVAQYKSLKSPFQGEGQERELQRAEEILRWIEIWKKEPIICMPRKLPHVGTMSRVELEKQGLRCIIRLSVHTFQRVPLTATTDKAKVTARVEENSWGGDNQLYFQREVAIEVPSAMLDKSFDMTLTVKSPNFPNFEARVPIYIEVPTPNRNAVG